MSDLYRVVIADAIHDQLEPERRVLEGFATVEALGATSEEQLLGQVDDADAVMVHNSVRITPLTIDRLQKCKLIVRCGVGYDNIDVKYAREKGIPVANVPDYGTEEVADSAIGLALSLTRGISFLNSRMRCGDWEWAGRQMIPLFRLRGRTMGIVGLGRIGSAVAIRAKALGMEVLYYDPYKADGYDKVLGIQRVETLDDLLSHSYVVSLHCPLTEETRHLIDADALQSMKTGSYLVNTSRGAVVDTAILPEALASGKLAGAGIDVLPQEPPAEDDPLIVAWRDPKHAAHHRLIINPHAAYYCIEGLEDIRSKAADACRRALSGMTVRNIVN